jgi:tetratricopeptide (TPR) repeat protein
MRLINPKTTVSCRTPKLKYEQALQLRPDNDYVKTQLEEVNKAIAQKSTANYDALMTKANNAFSSGQYEQALKSYYEALALKPGDHLQLPRLI